MKCGGVDKNRFLTNSERVEHKNSRSTLSELGGLDTSPYSPAFSYRAIHVQSFQDSLRITSNIINQLQ